VTDSYHVGLEVLARTGAELDARRNRVAEVAPDFARLAIGFAYGDVFSRPGLDLRLREFAAIAACAAMGRSAAQLRDHVTAALHLGWSKSEIIELLTQIAAHAGVPAALDALVWCHDLLVEITDCQTCEESGSNDGQE